MRVTLITVIVTAVLLSLGSLMAVRYLLNEYSGRGATAPPFARVGFASFLIATLGTAAIAAVGAWVAMNIQRRREDREVVIPPR
jgi:hypothetical protein